MDESTSRPNSTEPHIANMKVPGRRTTAFKLNLDETAEASEIESKAGGAKMKMPGRRTTRFALCLDVTNDEESSSPALEKPVKKPARSKAR